MLLFSCCLRVPCNFAQTRETLFLRMKKGRVEGAEDFAGAESGDSLPFSTMPTEAEGDHSQGAGDTWEHSSDLSPSPQEGSGAPQSANEIGPIGCPQGTLLSSLCYANEGEAHWLGLQQLLGKTCAGRAGAHRLCSRLRPAAPRAFPP